MLRKDQFLMMELFSKGDDTERKIQRGISRIQKKYFRELISSSNFVTSKFANNLSIRSAKDGTTESASNYLALAPPPYSDIHQGDEGFFYDEKGHEKASKTDPTKFDEEFVQWTRGFLLSRVLNETADKEPTRMRLLVPRTLGDIGDTDCLECAG